MSDRRHATRIAYWTATVGGIGRVPRMPGTAGSAVGLLLWVVTAPLPGAVFIQGGVLLVLLAAGIWAGNIIEKANRVDDPSYIVIDETLGMLLTVTALPLSWTAAVGGFILFRVFDIVKPWPIGSIQRIGGGLGIMIDDIAAGGVAAVLLRVSIKHLIPMIQQL